MAWDAVVTESIGELGFTSWFELVSKELAHVQVQRTDGGTNDTMLISVYASVDNGTTADNVPIFQQQLAPSTPAPIFSFGVTGVRYFRIQMAPIGALDTITCDVHVTRDGGLVNP